MSSNQCELFQKLAAIFHTQRAETIRGRRSVQECVGTERGVVNDSVMMLRSSVALYSGSSICVILHLIAMLNQLDWAVSQYGQSVQLSLWQIRGLGFEGLPPALSIAPMLPCP